MPSASRERRASRDRPASRDRAPRDSRRGTVLVAGATGFVGRAVVPALAASGWRVRGTTRRPRPGLDPRVEWVEADLARPADADRALEGAAAALYLVHGMAAGHGDYAEEERRTAATFAEAAARARVGRIVYLGGVAPRGRASRHLASRLAVGEVLRAGPVAAIELRASMIVGAGSASWKVVRDLALRLPAMVLPSWAESRTSPVAIDDVVRALVAALDVPLRAGAIFDLPGPEVLSMREILERVAALQDRALPAVHVPMPAPRISALWLKLVSDADWRVVRELVQGLEEDLLPQDDGFWALVAAPPRIPFDEAARRALAAERPAPGLRHAMHGVVEAVVHRFAPRLRGR